MDHIERQIQENVERGMSPPEARRQAMLTFGNVALTKEDTRAVWVWVWLEQLSQDARYVFRTLRRNPGFAAVAILTLALGIGGNTAVFSVVDSLLLRPPPFDGAERLYWIYDVNDELGLDVNDGVGVSPGNFVDWRDQSRSFDYMVAWRNWFFSVAGRDGADLAAEQVRGVQVSPAFFEMLGVQPALGRTFSVEEEHEGQNRVVVLTDGFWRRRFGADPGVLGQTVLVDGQPYSVIGVLPSDFYFLWQDSALFMPMTIDAEFRTSRTTHSVVVLARLAPGVRRSEAQAALDRLTANLERAYPNTNAGWGAALRPVFPLNRELRRGLLLLLAAVGCLLLIACINVANLLLVRAGVRQREISIRAAVGASRARLIRQMLTESVVLAVVAAAAGVLVAAVSLRLLTPLIPPVQVARPLTLAIDLRVLLFTGAVASLATVAFGMLPALQATRIEWLRVSAQVARTTSARRALLATEVALSVVLLVGATLFIKSLWNLQLVDPGFRAERLLTTQLWLPPGKYANPSRVSGFAHEVLRRLEQFPEIRAAATVNTRPFLGWEIGAAVDIPGRPPRIPDENLNINSKVISPGYVAALGARLIRGRGFAQHDGWDSAGVVLINEAMARRFWPTENPLGKNIRARFLGSVFTAPWWPHQATDTFTIVGIVGDIKERRLSDRAEPVIYFSYLQTPSRYMHLLVRTTSTPTSIIGVVQREIRAVDPDLGVYGMQTMESVLGEAVAEPRLRSLLLWVFAAIALLLSAVGVYGVTAHTGAERTREFAVRMAIGASSSALFGMVTRDALGVTVTGIAIGLGGALLLGRVLSSLLYEVAPTDAAVLAGAAGVVLVVALSASWRPAWRATRIDPMTVLRAE
jgi:putative ABC transport system permease protein